MVCPSPSTQTLDRTSCDATNTKWTCNINGSCRTASDCVSTQSCDDNGCVTVANSTDNNVCKNYNSNVQVCEAKDQSA